jgi:hypothetical protein
VRRQEQENAPYGGDAQASSICNTINLLLVLEERSQSRPSRWRRSLLVLGQKRERLKRAISGPRVLLIFRVCTTCREHHLLSPLGRTSSEEAVRSDTVTACLCRWAQGQLHALRAAALVNSTATGTCCENGTSDTHTTPLKFCPEVTPIEGKNPPPNVSAPPHA